ncbi:MAG: hypothetical protein JJU13_19230 [Balneolaceae bacterium]|nr:hypothetical protein [Balneolaceae bacterium]
MATKSEKYVFIKDQSRFIKLSFYIQYGMVLSFNSTVSQRTGSRKNHHNRDRLV